MFKLEKTRIVVMGCGGSGGVPYAGNVWKDCDPTNPKNRRTRPSIFVERGNTRIVIDTGPDFRNQINATGLTGGIDAIFYSHYHADHVSGIDDIRAFYFLRGQKAIDIYTCASTAQALTTRFDYIFRQSSPKYPPTAIMNVFEFGKTVTINQNLPIQLIKQTHGLIDCAGFRMGDFAYTPDVSHLDEVALNSLKGIKQWLVAANPIEDSNPEQAGLRQIREWVDIIKPQMTYLTHLNARGDYDALCRVLPPHIRPAYDGLEILLDK